MILGRFDGIIFLIIFAVYVLMMVFQAMRARNNQEVVQLETIVNPTRFWLIPKSMAILLAASTVRSPPNAIAAAPPTIHNRLFG